MSGLFIVNTQPIARLERRTPRRNFTKSKPSARKQPEGTAFEAWLRNPGRHPGEGIRLVAEGVPSKLKLSREWRDLSDRARVEVYRSIRDLGVLFHSRKSGISFMPDSVLAKVEKDIQHLRAGLSALDSGPDFPSHPEVRAAYTAAIQALENSIACEAHSGDSKRLTHDRNHALEFLLLIIGTDESNHAQVFRLLAEWFAALGGGLEKITAKSIKKVWHFEPDGLDPEDREAWKASVVHHRKLHAQVFRDWPAERELINVER